MVIEEEPTLVLEPAKFSGVLHQERSNEFGHGGCLVDLNGIVISVGDRTFDEAERIAEDLSDGEALLALPQYYNRPVGEVVDIEVALSNCRWLLAPGRIHYVPITRRPSGFKRNETPGCFDRFNRFYQGYWETEIREFVATIRETIPAQAAAA